MNEKILLVDDDPNILAAYKRQLRNKFKIATAENGTRGISFLTRQGPFAVIVSDFRMPEMDGIEFLSKARQIAPDTVRVMLTGQADLNVAINALNEGNLFRFLLKPCPEDFLMRTLEAAVDQYKLIMAERELLGETLKGSVKILIDILSVVNPVAFSQSSLIRDIAIRIAIRLNIKDLWEIELASMLSQIGCVAIPGLILNKKYLGMDLTDSEKETLLEHPGIGKKLLSNIPRLYGIAEAVAYQEKTFDGGGIPSGGKGGKEIPFTARILKVAIDFTSLRTAGKTPVQSLDIMHSNIKLYDHDIFAALEAEILSIKEGFLVKTVAINEISAGMVLADDIKDKKGVVHIPKNHEITEVTKMRLLNFARFGNVAEPIKILKKIPDAGV
ncbi:MAG: HD domain-containing phosphohydrolase [Eubacteriales bacterium]